MSVFSAFPILEIISLLVGGAATSFSFIDLIRSPKKADVFGAALKKRNAWRHFEAERLPQILQDKSISDKEWDEIIDLVDRIVAADYKIKGWKDMRGMYPARSEKAKRLLISEIISTKHSVKVSSN